MKRILLIAGFSFLAQAISAQTVPDSEMFLRKSRTQRNIGIALTAGGSIMAITGLLLWVDGFSNANVKGMDTGETLTIAGTVLAVGGIPFLVSARANREKAIRLSGELQSVRFLPSKHVAIPTLTLKLDL